MISRAKKSETKEIRGLGVIKYKKCVWDKLSFAMKQNVFFETTTWENFINKLTLSIAGHIGQLRTTNICIWR